MRKEAIPLGFLTVPFAPWRMRQVAEWGGENGFEFVEVAAWPSRTSRGEGEAGYVANHLEDLDDFPQGKADHMNDLLLKYGMKGMSSLAFYENMLAADPGDRAFYHSHLKKVIDAAQKLGVPLVGTFPGRHQGMSVDENLKEYGKVFPDLVKYASDHGVKLMFENCPMEGWIPGKRIGSICYCPKTWRAILEMTPEMGINMDPSHLVWQDIDYERATREFGKNIVHAHGKDAKVLERVYHEGTIGEDRPLVGWGLGLYEHRIPGQGDVNWKKFTDALRETDYKGVLSVELEAPQYAPQPIGGNMPYVQLGVRTARENLAPFCKALD